MQNATKMNKHKKKNKNTFTEAQLAKILFNYIIMVVDFNTGSWHLSLTCDSYIFTGELQCGQKVSPLSATSNFAFKKC